MKIKKVFIMFLVVIFTFSYCLQIQSFSINNNLAEANYVGPGRYETNLIVIEGGEISKNYTDVGTAIVWNTRNELTINIQTDNNWKLKEVYIYAGNGNIPVSSAGNPLINKFPYKEKFKTDTSFYEFSLDMIEDLDITWGQRDEYKRFPKVSICVKLDNKNIEKSGLQQAWAYGNSTFDINSGWWMDYAMVHPKTGHFIDSPVSGINYETPTNKGKTDSGGAFDYIEGEEVELYIGDVFIGKTTAKQKITPVDLLSTEDAEGTEVMNMAKILQSFDSDGDPNAGITISSRTVDAFEEVVEEMEIDQLDFSDTEQVDKIIKNTNDKVGNKLTVVGGSEALDNLKKGTTSNMVRKNISKTSEMINTKAKLEVMTGYVPAQKANGELVTLEYFSDELDEDENPILTETRNIAKPLVAVYTNEIEGTGASDIFAAISRDEGATWQRKNLSKSADKSSFKLEDGTDYPGDVRKPQVRVKGNYILVAWTSKYAKTGKPTYAITTGDEESETYYPYDDPYAEKDIWGVSGPQRSVDYADQGFPEVGEVPYSVIWACRGVIDKVTGDITWYKPERLTSGRRDAFQLMMNGVEDAGFSLIWQEDPEGLRPGEEAGPGEGWSGATTNHKTDIWYSYITWDDFPLIDENFDSSGVSQTKDEELIEEDEEIKGREKYLVPLKLPVRLSDNDTVNLDNMKVTYSEEFQAKLDAMEPGDRLKVNNGDLTANIDELKTQGTHSYGYEDISEYDDDLIVCNELYYKVNNQESNKYVAVTSEEVLLDGNTGASRPNIMLQKYQKPDGTYSAWAVVCYEETKGVGAGPPEDEDEDNDDDNTSGGSGKKDEIVETSPSDEEEFEELSSTNEETDQVDTYTSATKTKGNSSKESNDDGDDENSNEFTSLSIYGDDKAAVLNDDNYDDEGNTEEAMEDDDVDQDEEDNENDSDDSDKGSGTQGTGSSSEGVGEQKGKESYVPDEGKYVVYHTFDFQKPDVVSAGEIINPQVIIDDETERDFYRNDDGEIFGEEEDGKLYLVDEEGNNLLDWKGDKVPAFENARRPRLIIQGKSAAIAGKSDSTKGTVLVMVYKMGEEGKGRPSDIFMKRWEVCKLDKGNPYQHKYMLDEVQNISSVTVDIEEDTIINDNRSDSSKGDGVKVLRWEQKEANLDDESWVNSYDDARAHRGILRGDTLAIAYDWTPNWAAARNGNDVYNLYVRRSFDGGESFTTDPDPNSGTVIHTDTYKLGLGDGSGSDERTEDTKETVETFYEPGVFEPARNLSQLSNNKNSVIEPRLVGGPSTIYFKNQLDGMILSKKATETTPALYSFPEDIRDTNAFWVTYGTSTNPSKNSTESKEPMDLYYSYTSDFGQTYYTEEKEINSESTGYDKKTEDETTVTVWDWLAKDTGNKKASQAECQIRMSPDGTVFYSVWNEVGENGSDVMFRRIINTGGSIDTQIEYIDETAPIINIVGIHDEDVINEDMVISIELNELGSFEADLVSLDTNKLIKTYEDDFTIYADDTEKSYLLKVKAKDLNNNKSEKSISFKIDGRVPTINIGGVANYDQRQTNVDLYVGTSGSSESIVLMKDGEEIPSDNNMTLGEEGFYELFIESTSKYTAKENICFTIDKTPPVITFKGVEDDGKYRGSTRPEVFVTDNLSDTLSVLTIKLNDSDYLSATNISKTGDYTLSAYAVDLAGNTTLEEINFVVANKKNTSSSEVLFENEFIGEKYTEVKGELDARSKNTIYSIDNKLSLNIPANTLSKNFYYSITPIEDIRSSSKETLKIGEFTYEISFTDSEGEDIEKFDKDIQIGFSLDGEASYEDLKICYWDGNLKHGNWVVLPSDINESNNTIIANTNHLSIYSLMQFEEFPEFNDCCNHWAKRDIYRIASLGICCGDEKGRFNPDNYTTREELAKILINSLDLETDEIVEIEDMTDVSDWANGYVQQAVALGLMDTDTDNNFNPKRFASRENLLYAAKYGFTLTAQSEDHPMFADYESIDPELIDTLELMAQNNIIKGYEDNTFRPHNMITRGELVRIISEYLDISQ